MTSQKGFTLLEMMIAMSILTIAIVSIFKLQGQSVNMISSVRFYTQAPLLARLALSRFEARLVAEDPELDSDSGAFGEDFPGYEYSIIAQEIEDIDEDFEYITKYIKTVDVTVTWDELGISYSIHTTMFLDMI
ncbi:MAG: prepilin-type N-terminal cleavage/methylation domain-containing protein [Candidatus Magnetomorum sp.]|nr:prepilin-type N-terminal cleavage/methylation domain-containing protein [Candidatus Magnetomorum sp.]